MPRKKKIETPTPAEETPVAEAPVEEPNVVVDSPEKKRFKALIERYKAQSPEKYALKEAELLSKLDRIK